MAAVALWCAPGPGVNRFVRAGKDDRDRDRASVDLRRTPPVLKTLLVHLAQQAWRGLRRMPAVAAAPLRAAFDAAMERDDYHAARALAEAALAREPGGFEPQLLLGRAFQKLHDPVRAMALFDAALAQRPEDAELRDFRGALLQETGRLDQACAEFARALELRPGFALAAFHLGMARLLAGDYERGWAGYELRRLSAGYETLASGRPRWDGAPLAGRTLLVAREQGLGDEIMFASLLPELAAQAGRLVVECDPRLVPLFRRSFPSATVFGTPAGGALPDAIAQAGIDFAIEVGSLSALLRRRAADFPRHAGYLRADPARVRHWRAQLDALGAGPKIGIAWTGGVRRTRRELRSMDLGELLPLLRLPGARFVSLQYTPGAQRELEALRARHGIEVAHWPEAIADYEETAALVCALDGVASVCTAVVHLAGALGRRALVMAPVSPEWRYGIHGETMPWYPSVRVFRQPSYGAWEPVVAAVAREVSAWRA